MRWLVSTTMRMSGIAAQSGVPEAALREAGVDPRMAVGSVEAATLGEAIMRAREQFPQVSVAYLNVRPMPPGVETT